MPSVLPGERGRIPNHLSYRHDGLKNRNCWTHTWPTGTSCSTREVTPTARPDHGGPKRPRHLQNRPPWKKIRIAAKLQGNPGRRSGSSPAKGESRIRVDVRLMPWNQETQCPHTMTTIRQHILTEALLHLSAVVGQPDPGDPAMVQQFKRIDSRLGKVVAAQYKERAAHRAPSRVRNLGIERARIVLAPGKSLPSFQDAMAEAVEHGLISQDGTGRPDCHRHHPPGRKPKARSNRSIPGAPTRKTWNGHSAGPGFSPGPPARTPPRQ